MEGYHIVLEMFSIFAVTINQCIMKKVSLFFMVILLACVVQAQVVKVACVGNSITYGANIEDREHHSYPFVLGELLGNGYEVKNFGFSARTLLRKGDYPYMKEAMFKEALAYEPNIVIIKMGTNDSKPQNWKYGNEFEQDLTDMVDSFLCLASHPKVYLCRPVPAYETKWGISNEVISKEIFPIIKKVAKKKKLKLIDLYTPLSGKENLFPDKIHPNAEGAAIMANVVCKVIKKNK